MSKTIDELVTLFSNKEKEMYDTEKTTIDFAQFVAGFCGDSLTEMINLSKALVRKMNNHIANLHVLASLSNYDISDETIATIVINELQWRELYHSLIEISTTATKDVFNEQEFAKYTKELDLELDQSEKAYRLMLNFPESI